DHLLVLGGRKICNSRGNPRLLHLDREQVPFTGPMPYLSATLVWPLTRPDEVSFNVLVWSGPCELMRKGLIGFKRSSFLTVRFHFDPAVQVAAAVFEDDRVHADRVKELFARYQSLDPNFSIGRKTVGFGVRKTRKHDAGIQADRERQDSGRRQ